MARPNIKVALCQFNTQPPPKEPKQQEGEGTTRKDHQEENFIRARHFISQASQNNADLIIFPEYFITGIIENDLHLASKESKWINQFQNLAREFHIDIVPGTIVEQESVNVDSNHPNQPPPPLFNSAYYIDKSGQILNKYRKKNLWHSEKYLTPCTNENKVFEALNGIRIGMLICWDLAWPEAFRDLMKQKVDMIIIPSYWTLDVPESKMIKYDATGQKESNLIDSLIISRALEVESCVVFVNCAGKGQDGFLGRSAVALPLLGHLLKIDKSEEHLSFANIDLNVLNDAKEVYKISEEFNSKSFSQFY